MNANKAYLWLLKVVRNWEIQIIEITGDQNISFNNFNAF
jgi:hypothetical protein